MKRLTVLLVLLAVVYGGTARAGFIFANPFGANVSGSANSGVNPHMQNDSYTNGDQFGSGTLTLHASGSAGVGGAFSSSVANVPGNQVTLTANADTSLTTVQDGATASGAIWDTLSFSGGTPGEFGTFVLSGSSSSNSIFAAGNALIEAAPVLVSGGLVQSPLVHLPGGQSNFSVKTSIFFPLDTGPVQFVETAVVSTSTSVSSRILSSHITFDPEWTFVLPPGVSLTSASGTVYSTTTGVPDTGTTVSFLGLSLMGLSFLRRKLC